MSFPVFNLKSVVVSISSFLQIVKKHEGSITAVATSIAAVASVAATIFALKTVRISSESLQQSRENFVQDNRPYITARYFSDTGVSVDDKKITIKVHGEIENTGKRPAYFEFNNFDYVPFDITKAKETVTGYLPSVLMPTEKREFLNTLVYENVQSIPVAQDKFKDFFVIEDDRVKLNCTASCDQISKDGINLGTSVRYGEKKNDLNYFTTFGSFIDFDIASPQDGIRLYYRTINIGEKE